MNVVFRVDSSKEIGSGHVMRCLTLAEELEQNGANITFVMRAHLGHMAEAVLSRGFSYVLLEEPNVDFHPAVDDVAHAKWLDVQWLDDAKETIDALGCGGRPDWLVVDHYSIDRRWHRELRKHVNNILVIDDLADRELDCDILLDQTYGRKEIDYKLIVSGACRMFLGSQYAMLGSKFLELRHVAVEKRKHIDSIRRILVCMGGMDLENVTADVLSALALVHWKRQPIVDVVLGCQALHLTEIRHYAEEMPYEVTVSVDVDDMAERMVEADFAIGAGGSTSWERCCLGLPALMISTADNQINVVRQIGKADASIILGSVNQVSISNIQESIEDIAENVERVKRMSSQCLQLVDGVGVRRVVLGLLPIYSSDHHLVTTRRIVLDDADLLYKWQQFPETRRYSHSDCVPGRTEHAEWINNRVLDVCSYTEIILHGDEPAGVVRMDPIDGEKSHVYMISIYIAPAKYKLGLGKAALYIIRRLLPGAEFRAEVHENNIASHALFNSVGFKKVDGIRYVSSPS